MPYAIAMPGRGAGSGTSIVKRVGLDVSIERSSQEGLTPTNPN